MRPIFDRTGTYSEVQHWRMLLNAGTRLHAALAKRSEHCALAVLDEDGVVVSWYDQLFGPACTSDGVLYQHVSQFYMERDVAAGVPARSLRCAADCGIDIQEGWRRRPGGAIYWGTTTLETVADGDGHTFGFAHITRRVQGPWEVTHLAMRGRRQARRTRSPTLRMHRSDAPAQVAL
jgi:hypothetical protein